VLAAPVVLWPVKDKIGVFVSIVSTKIPFKGTGKEYIGDDVEEMQAAVKVCATLSSGQL
jgi:DNA topoisomerase VI subunit B